MSSGWNIPARCADLHFAPAQETVTFRPAAEDAAQASTPSIAGMAVPQ